MSFLDAWSSGFDHGPVLIDGELSMMAPDGGTIARRSRRMDVDLGAGLRQRGAASVAAQVLDLSIDGFRARTCLELGKGDDVWLRLPGLEALAARVVWIDGTLIGCAFARPLHSAVLEMIIARARR